MRRALPCALVSLLLIGQASIAGAVQQFSGPPFQLAPGASANNLSSSMSGDCGITSLGAVTCLTTGGVPFARSATTDTTNAGNITSGTLPGQRLPPPTSGVLGGVKAATAPTNQFMTGVDATGAPIFGTPSLSTTLGSGVAGALANAVNLNGGVPLMNGSVANGNWVEWNGGLADAGVPFFTPLKPSNNLSELTSYATARATLKAAPHVQSYAQLIAATTSTYPSGVWRDTYISGLTYYPLPAPIFYLPSTTPCAAATITGSASGNTLTVATVTAPSVLAVGMTIQGAGFAAGTTLTAGSGSSWTFSGPPVTVSLETITFGDYASQVVSNDGLCWIAQWTGPADIRQWGARQGYDSSTAMSQAFAFGCLSHVPLELPYPGNTPYKLASPQVLGNGSETQRSSCNGVTFKVDHPYYAYTGTTPTLYPAFIWTGAAGAVPLTLQGPAQALNLINFTISCNSICATGIVIDNVLYGTEEGLGVTKYTGPCMIVTSSNNNTWQGSNERTVYNQIECTEPGSGGSGAQVGDIQCATIGGCINDVQGDVFNSAKMIYDNTVAGTCGVTFGRMSRNVFINWEIDEDNDSASNLGHGFCIKPSPGDTSFPRGNTLVRFTMHGGFLDPGAGWTGAGVGAAFHIIDWTASADADPFPVSTNPSLLFGNDDNNVTYPLQFSGTKTAGSCVFNISNGLIAGVTGC